MRKVLWCSLTAGVLAASCFLALAHYAYRCPESLVGRSMLVISQASVAMQPLNGLTSLAVRTGHATVKPDPIEATVPTAPQPLAPPRIEDEPSQAQKEDAFIGVMHDQDGGLDAAPIVIGEDEPMPPIPEVVVAPRSQDDELPMVPPRMPYADEGTNEHAKADAKKRGGSSEETEESVFKAWIELFKEEKTEKGKAPTVEQLPPPTEEQPRTEPKCQEDSHMHEQYPGCPRVTSPYGRKHPSEPNQKRAWEIDPKIMKKGGQENSEEPQADKKTHHDKEQCPRTRGVDTMEYRKSDAGLGEYGPGPIH